MVNCAVKNWEGEEVSQINFEWRVAKPENASHIVHRALVRQMTNSRQGTASAKTRSEVRGGGRKPWRQKGTGRARAGSIRSPLWRGGGVIFGPKPRNFEVKMNRKEKRLALRTAFQDRLADAVVVEDFNDQLPRPKTKEIYAALQRWGIDPDNSRVLAIAPKPDPNLYLSMRNLPGVKLIYVNTLNIYDLLAADRLVITSTAMNQIREVYGDD